MSKSAVEVPVLSAAIGAMKVPISLAVSANGFVFISGVPPMDCATGLIVHGDIEVQTTACLQALNQCLAAAGSSLGDVVSARIYASNAGHYGAINATYAKFFSDAPPARTFVAVGSWPHPFDIEIECVALAGASQ